MQAVLYHAMNPPHSLNRSSCVSPFVSLLQTQADKRHEMHQTRRHAHTHGRTHTHTRAHAHTRTHTHTHGGVVGVGGYCYMHVCVTVGVFPHTHTHTRLYLCLRVCSRVLTFSELLVKDGYLPVLLLQHLQELNIIT